MASTAAEILHEKLWAEFESIYSDSDLINEYENENEVNLGELDQTDIDSNEDFQEFKQMKFDEYKDLRV